MSYVFYLILFVVLGALAYGIVLFFLKCLSCARDPAEYSEEEREIEKEYMTHDFMADGRLDGRLDPHDLD